MRKDLKLFSVFLIFIFIFIMNLLIPINKNVENPYSTRLFVICFIITLVITIYIILKTKKLEKRHIFLGIVFGIIAGVKNPFMGIITVITYIGSGCIFKYTNVNIPVFKEITFKGVTMSIIIATIYGVVLGIINLLLGMNQFNLSISFSYIHLINALRAGICEEIAFRLFMFAICIYLLNGSPKSKMENSLSYVIMIVPHVLLHFPDIIAANDFGSIIGSVVILSLLFGLPFALLQRKRDLFSAITAHTLVDLIRFICLGV